MSWDTYDVRYVFRSVHMDGKGRFVYFVSEYSVLVCVSMALVILRGYSCV
jgi:hypothetical protein